MLKVKACAQHACTTRLAIAVDHGYAYIELKKKKTDTRAFVLANLTR